MRRIIQSVPIEILLLFSAFAQTWPFSAVILHGLEALPYVKVAYDRMPDAGGYEIFKLKKS